MYWFGLSCTALVVLILLVTPVRRHAGINDHPGAGFRRMLNGSADFPFRTRILMPGIVESAIHVLPQSLQFQSSRLVESNSGVGWLFRRLHWETDLALHYLLACFSMLLSLVGFAHFTAAITISQCKFNRSPGLSGLLAILALIGVPAFFRYTSFIYDPLQLFIFAGALYFISLSRLVPFCLLFLLGSMNKETALLLIPIAYTHLKKSRGALFGQRLAMGLFIVYCLVRTPLYLPYAGIGDSPILHLLDHNVQWLAQGYGPLELAAGIVFLLALTYCWNMKPYFLRLSMIWILVPLILLAVPFGYVDEWRDYYEAYPACFGLTMHTLASLIFPKSRSVWQNVGREAT